jgi:hypothetical protein
MDLNELKKIVETSFLPTADKKEVLDLLASGGETPEFYQRFDDLLVAELKKRDAVWQDVSARMDAEMKTLDVEVEQKEKQLMDQLQKDLKGISPLDMQKKTEIFEKYYKSLDLIDKDHLDRLQKLTAKFTLEVMPG